MIKHKLWSFLLACTVALGSTDAFAKRMGGGGSFGKQSGNVTQRNAAPSQPNQAPAQQAAPANSSSAAQRPATAPAAAAAPKRPWGAMLGGLAAGLGLAWLASSLGLGEAFGQILMFILLAVAVMAVIGFIMRRRAPAAGNGMAYQGAGAGAARAPLDLQPQTPPSYSPKNVGNDASARPWERSSHSGHDHHGSQTGSMIGSALLGRQSWGIPAGFDVDGFIKASKANFVSLQSAWDRADIASLRAMMTDEMLGEIRSQLAERENDPAQQGNHTEVVMLEAQLLGVEELDDEYMASVEFSGMLREEASGGPSPFREVWNVTRSKSGRGGWLVAGVQSLQ